MTDASIRRRFAETVAQPDDQIDLFDAALLIAKEEYPELDRGFYQSVIDSLTMIVWDRLESVTEPYTIVNLLSEFLFDEQGFRGNEADYYDPRNSYVNDVLDRRLGIPITLSLVYCEVARRLGLPVVGVGLPGHFVVKYVTADDEIVIDPFNRGIILTPEDCAALVERATGGVAPFRAEHLAPIGPKDILARMLSNLKGIYLQASDFPRALAAVERIALLQPHRLTEVRDRGLLRRQVGDLRGAISDLESYVNHSRATANAEIRQLIELLRREAGNEAAGSA